MSLRCDFLKADVKRSLAKVSGTEGKFIAKRKSLSVTNRLKGNLELCTNVTKTMNCLVKFFPSTLE